MNVQAIAYAKAYLPFLQAFSEGKVIYGRLRYANTDKQIPVRSITHMTRFKPCDLSIEPDTMWVATVVYQHNAPNCKTQHYVMENEEAAKVFARHRSDVTLSKWRREL